MAAAYDGIGWYGGESVTSAGQQHAQYATGKEREGCAHT